MAAASGVGLSWSQVGAVFGDGGSVVHREESAETPTPSETKNTGRRHLEHQRRPHHRGDQQHEGQTEHDLFPGGALSRRRGVDLHTKMSERDEGCVVAIRRDIMKGRSMNIDRCEGTIVGVMLSDGDEIIKFASLYIHLSCKN